MIFAGLDLSLTETGVAFIHSDTERYTAVIKPKDTLKGIRRLGYIRDQLDELLPGHGPMVVAVEGYAMGANGRVFNIGELGGIVKLMLLDRPETVALDVPPTSLKMCIAENGNADKKAMIAAASRLFGKPTRNDNEADAMGLALVARAWFDGNEITSRQARAMTKIFPLFPLDFSHQRNAH